MYMCQKLKCENEYLRVWVSFKKIKNVAVSLLKTLSHTQRACVCVSRNRLCKCLSALAVMAFLCLRGATSFHWLNKIFFHLFNLNRGCVLSFLTPSPLSLTHTHTFLYTVLQRARHQSKVFGMRQRCWQICDCLLACVCVLGHVH